MGQTVEQIKALLAAANAEELAALERSLAADTRKGVVAALAAARKRMDARLAELQRLQSMVDFQQQLAEGRGGGVIVGLDEVGRGPLAGPLAVGAVVLPPNTVLDGLNDSKQLTPEQREETAERIKQTALAWTVQYMQPEEIDACGMTACLVTAFRRAVAAIEQAGVAVDVVLLDGNPLHMDPREINVVKGDAKCASIAAASIVAKVERDNLMIRLAQDFPQYGFDKHKGYGSAFHMAAIREYGLCPLHRKSFCTAFDQPTLF
ncbi:MAG: ribonuclease HII [Coriobacteriia bacterium]|nr:ribonuclease HII [Coriobacteriia bacterium]